MKRHPLTVLKLGGSVLRDESDLPVAVAEVRRHQEAGHRVLAVVSALGGTTEKLLASARRLSTSPDPASLTALLATGEATSAALLALALDAVGLRTTVLEPAHVGPFTNGPLLDAEPLGLDGGSILEALERRPIAVLPGFIGRSLDGEVSVLGRGGSDLTALFAAHFLAADRCRLLKDVDGVYEGDPAAGGVSRRYRVLSWGDALALDPCILQPKALLVARRYRIAFEVGRPGEPAGTRVGAGPTVVEDPARPELHAVEPRPQPSSAPPHPSSRGVDATPAPVALDRNAPPLRRPQERIG